MDSNNKDPKDNIIKDLSAVKQRTASELSKIILQIDDNNPQYKFETAMSALKYCVSAEIANIALECALKVEDTQARSEMLMQILSEISYLEDSIK